MFRKFVPVLLLLALALMIVPAAAQDTLIPVRVQLKWVTQAQFAGYYAALNAGFYEAEGLDVTILPGGPDIGPNQVVAAGGAEFGINWIGDFLSAREQGANFVNIGQIFQRSGMREVSWKDGGPTTFKELAGKTVGVWGFGNQFPLFAALVKNGIDPDNPDDITIFNQPFDMNAFLNREIDAAAAMTYNELAQVLEYVGEDGTFPVYTIDDLNVLDLNTEGTALLEDFIFANADWLAGKTGDISNEEIATRFLKASFRGWAHCRDEAADCVQWVLDSGSTLGKGHQTWMMNEINKLIWPSPAGIGIVDADLYKQSAEIALNYAIITKEAAGEGVAYRNDLTLAAHEALKAEYPDLDLVGEGWKAAEVAITPNGE